MRKIFAVLAALICCLSAWTSVPAAQAFTLDKEDGEYSIQVELEGGSGKASVTSPTLITVKSGEVTADIQWSSSNYDYMIVDGKKYLPVNEEGTNSEFQIPVTKQELCRKRLLDLSRQADRKGIVLFSDFLNLNEQNIFHSLQKELYTTAELSGGYEQAERQMVAFIPDALCYEWSYPFVCIHAVPQYPKYAEKLTHRDVLGALMHLGLDRSKIGDIVLLENDIYIFCSETISDFIIDQFKQIRHTMIRSSIIEDVSTLKVHPVFEEHDDMVASNRIDAIIARAYHLSRSEAAAYLTAEKVFINGRCITNCNQSCDNGDIVSVRQKGRFVFETDQSLSKKGKLRVRFMIYK